MIKFIVAVTYLLIVGIISLPLYALVNIIGNAIVEYSENRKPLDEVLDEVDKQLEMKDKEE